MGWCLLLLYELRMDWVITTRALRAAIVVVMVYREVFSERVDKYKQLYFTAIWRGILKTLAAHPRIFRTIIIMPQGETVRLDNIPE